MDAAAEHSAGGWLGDAPQLTVSGPSAGRGVRCAARSDAEGTRRQGTHARADATGLRRISTVTESAFAKTP